MTTLNIREMPLREVELLPEALTVMLGIARRT